MPIKCFYAVCVTLLRRAKIFLTRVPIRGNILEKKKEKEKKQQIPTTKYNGVLMLSTLDV